MYNNIKNKSKSPYLQQFLTNKSEKRHLNKKKITLVIILLIIIMIMIGKTIPIKNKEEIEVKQPEIEISKSQNSSTIQEKLDILNIPMKDKEYLEETIQDTNCDDTTESPTQNTNYYDYSKPVPESQTVGLEYFNDAVFIGDSRTEGFVINNGLVSKAKCYTHQGLKVDTIFTDRIININGNKVTIIEALQKTKFSKVYIMLGINETGWVYSDLFIRKYSQIIEEIKKINPESIIYVQSILPVSQSVSDTHKYIKNNKIEEYNKLLQKMAKDKNVYYLDVKQAVVNEYGALSDDSATDGIHLNKQYCLKWMEYLRNHIV